MNTGPHCILSVIFIGFMWQHWFRNTIKYKFISDRENPYRFIRVYYLVLVSI